MFSNVFNEYWSSCDYHQYSCIVHLVYFLHKILEVKESLVFIILILLLNGLSEPGRVILLQFDHIKGYLIGLCMGGGGVQSVHILLLKLVPSPITLQHQV